MTMIQFALYFILVLYHRTLELTYCFRKHYRYEFVYALWYHCINACAKMTPPSGAPNCHALWW
jgi:hypothetical protein